MILNVNVFRREADAVNSNMRVQRLSESLNKSDSKYSQMVQVRIVCFSFVMYFNICNISVYIMLTIVTLFFNSFTP